MTYSIILRDGIGAPRGHYETKEQALAAAKRLQRRCNGEADVVWCRDGVAKVWLANVGLSGLVTFTKFWS